MTDKIWTQKAIERVAAMIDAWLNNYTPTMIDQVYHRWLGEHGVKIKMTAHELFVERCTLEREMKFLSNKLERLERDIHELREERRGASLKTEGV